MLDHITEGTSSRVGSKINFIIKKKKKKEKKKRNLGKKSSICHGLLRRKVDSGKKRDVGGLAEEKNTRFTLSRSKRPRRGGGGGGGGGGSLLFRGRRRARKLNFRKGLHQKQATFHFKEGKCVSGRGKGGIAPYYPGDGIHF